MKVKILIGRIGLDGHDRGLRAVANALAGAGFDVVYSGLYRNAEEFVSRAIEEKVDAIGISCLTGAHNVVFRKVIGLMSEKGIENIPVFGGGTIPEEDIEGLKKIGVKKVFLPGATLEEIVDFVKGLVRG
ncbi:MAG: cobalamin B12-binding domain-containing protein [Candidatus Scalindua sp.]